ncbi:unnamed protein product [Nippostrongylus brasiliensis]|uniref:Methyltransf_21 domain-containing protein n=1 Tax=Nippostrongylus brasiliensis TaxID=27835 RepID=A0A0N4XFE9_NIPBR|nr:unnamed protein product [Nippostrongylus brasiliensis]
MSSSTSNHHESDNDTNQLDAFCTPYTLYILVLIYVLVSIMTDRGLWSKTPMIVNQCSQRRFLRIRGFSNADEIKAFSSTRLCSMVTLGVGRDVEVEVKMKKMMPECSFFGADPVREPNEQLFETFVDQLMIDTEWAEYDILPYLLKSGDLENTGVVLCQVNVEIHRPNYEQKVQFFEFFLELLDDRRYTPLVAETMLGHTRLYLLNHENKECRYRYA